MFTPTSYNAFLVMLEAMDDRVAKAKQRRALQEEKITSEFPQLGTEHVEGQGEVELRLRRFGCDVLHLILFLRYEILDSGTQELAYALESQSAAGPDLP